MKFVLLWHMHQPIYRNGLTGEYELPWVFLHAIKDYYDMPWHISRFPKLKATFNLTPSLVYQLEDYASGNANCKFLRLMEKPVKELEEDEKTFLIRIFFSPSPNLFSHFELYKRLYLNYQRDSLKEFCRNLTNQDFLNLEVFFLLSWCGSFLRKNNPLVRNMLEEGSAFSEDAKGRLLSELKLFIGKILPLYRELERKGQIEISTTPFYHPILPLLLDMSSAKESVPDIRLPAVHANLRKDGEAQLDKALSFHRKRFKEALGVWPAEGGISNDTIGLFIRKGIRWTASDEDVLFRSLEEHVGTREPLYRVYSYRDSINLIFRDKELSSLIGFVYRGWRPDDAAKDFIERLRRIESSYDEPVVSVILDGENCWEFYDKNGFDFREKLYSSLSESEWIDTVKPSELEASSSLRRVVAGSWIGGNFLTWIGDPDKNRAWELIGMAKLQFEKSGKENEEANEHILISEGSDWFWWLGKGHYTPFPQEFDRLFRSHLIKVYRILGSGIPNSLFTPVKRFKAKMVKPPKCYISVNVDGEVSSYFEWLNSGEIELLEFPTMDSLSFIMRKAYYGYNENRTLFLRVDGQWKKLIGRNLEVVVELSGEEVKSFSFSLKNGRAFSPECESAVAVLGRILEVSIPSDCLGKLSRSKAGLKIKLFVDGKLFEEAPPFSFATVDMSRNFETEWMV
ncbi:MAG: glycoside hydrolase [Nitrospiraceae bacterium]|nr:glycoside hydrolase [Nitrospiraceae bacterium]